MKYRNGGELLAALCPIRPAWGLNLGFLAPETNAFQQGQLGKSDFRISSLNFRILVKKEKIACQANKI